MEIGRAKRISELVYKAKHNGATFEEVISICKLNYVCVEVAKDAYQRTGSDYGKPQP